MRNTTLNNIALLALVAYVTAVFIMTCARPVKAEDDCADPTLAVVALPINIAGLRLVCIFEGVH